MKSLLLVTDPLAGRQSTQFDLARSIAIHLSNYYRVTVCSILIDERKKDELEKYGIQAISMVSRKLLIDSLLRMVGRNNESMLWLESWLREGLFERNCFDVSSTLQAKNYDFIINATNTVPVRCDIWWVQGPPLLVTLSEMSNENPLAKLGVLFARSFIHNIDDKLLLKMKTLSERIVVNANNLSTYYRSIGVHVDATVYNVPDLNDFHPSSNYPRNDFVLTYIGKETEIDTIKKVAERGVRMVGFGSKLPPGTKEKELRRFIDFRGFIDIGELVDLYSNALFTLFPFTNEPLGWIPLESMACGTPVLTYNKQGPSETVIDGRTGWLASSKDELVEKAIEIWNRRDTDIAPEDCVRRTQKFSSKNSAVMLKSILENSHVKNSIEQAS
jgi:glycosyltransferase involved in cell wall biosynthesis